MRPEILAMSERQFADYMFENGNRFADDLYPGKYTRERCDRIGEYFGQIKTRLVNQGATTLAHNYVSPELQEMSDLTGDSLGLSLHVQQTKAPVVYYISVFFMAETAKVIVGDTTRMFALGHPNVIGCSLVFGTDIDWILKWKQEHPGGIVVTYINSRAYPKAISDYVATSHNMDKVIVHAARVHPDSQILTLPDRFLGYVMKDRAIAQGVPGERIEVYEKQFGGYKAACHVHDELIPSDSMDIALWQYPDAELMIHPECGCASSCLLKVEKHEGIPDRKAYYLSTGAMIKHAQESSAKKFLVATETGMLYRLRKALPEKEFLPVDTRTVCRFMKACTIEGFLDSLEHERVEIVTCNDCCDPNQPYQDHRVVHIQRSIADQAKLPIERMLRIT